MDMRPWGNIFTVLLALAAVGWFIMFLQTWSIFYLGLGIYLGLFVCYGFIRKRKE